jgi:hypothetical protein
MIDMAGGGDDEMFLHDLTPRLEIQNQRFSHSHPERSEGPHTG